MTDRRNFTADAEALFQEIISEAGLRHERDLSAPVELLWRLPVQAGLSVEMQFGLQNADELNLGIGRFWSSMFPFNKVQRDFRRLALGFIEGRCRVAEWRRMGLLYKKTLEEPEGSTWRTAYTEHVLPLPLPFGQKKLSYTVNTCAPSRG